MDQRPEPCSGLYPPWDEPGSLIVWGETNVDCECDGNLSFLQVLKYTYTKTSELDLLG